MNTSVQAFNQTMGVAPAGMTKEGPPELSAPEITEKFTPPGAPDLSEAALEKSAAPATATKPGEELPGAKLMRMRRASRKLERDRQQLAAEKSRLEAEGKEIGGALAAMRSGGARYGQHQRVVDVATQLIETAKRDPAGMLRSLGWSDDKVRDVLLDELRPPTPAEARELARAEARRVLDEERAAYQSAHHADASRAQSTERVNREVQQFVSIARDASRWPMASRLRDEKLVRRGWEIVQEAKHAGERLTDEQILDRLDADLASAAGSKPGSRAKGAADDEASDVDLLALELRDPDAAKALVLREIAKSRRPEEPAGIDVLSLSDDEQAALTRQEIEKAMRAPRKRKSPTNGTYAEDR